MEYCQQWQSKKKLKKTLKIYNMKKLLLILLLFPCFLFAQESKPFKGAKKIIAEYALSGDSLYNQLSKTLLVSEYKIDKRDKDLLAISTEPKHIKFIDYKIQLYVDGHKAIFTGTANNGMSMQSGLFKTDSQWLDVDYRSKADLRRNCFDDIDKFVRGTSPLTITYNK